MNTYEKFFKTEEEWYQKYKNSKGTIIINENTNDEFIFVPLEVTGTFKILSLRREDIDSIGYDSNCISDEIMDNISRKIADNVIENVYWNFLENYCESHNIPKIEFGF